MSYTLQCVILNLNFNFLRFLSFGGQTPQRPVKDLAFATARFFQRGGILQNYYMVYYIFMYAHQPLYDSYSCIFVFFVNSY